MGGIDAETLDEGLVGLDIRAAAKLATLVQACGNVGEERIGQAGIVEHLPRFEHDGVRECLLAEFAHKIAPGYVFSCPSQRRQQVLRPQGTWELKEEMRVPTDVLLVRRAQKREDFGRSDM